MALKQYSQKFGLFILLLVILLLWFLSRFIRIDISAIEGWLSAFPLALRGIIYIILYVIITFLLFFSKDLFWFMGAFLFGPFLSATFICIAEVINAFILFYLARLLGRSYVENRLSDKYRHLDDKLGRINFFWLFIFRAAPLIPYRFLDLASGLTKMRFRKYLIAVILGTPVKMFWIQYLIYALGTSIFNNPKLVSEYFLSHRALLLFSFIYIILIVMAVVKIAKKD